MAKTHKQTSLARDLWEYLKATGWGWWLAVAALFGFYDQIGRFLPKKWVQDMPPWLPEFVAITALLVGPFLAFRKKNRQVELLRARLREQSLHDLRMAAVSARLDLQIGERPGVTPMRRFERGQARLQELETEINSGNFSNALEVLLFKDVFLDVAAQCVPPAAVGWRDLQARVSKIVWIVEEHVEQIAQAQED
jgi:hypothetical protein